MYPPIQDQASYQHKSSSRQVPLSLSRRSNYHRRVTIQTPAKKYTNINMGFSYDAFGELLGDP